MDNGNFDAVHPVVVNYVAIENVVDLDSIAYHDVAEMGPMIVNLKRVIVADFVVVILANWADASAAKRFVETVRPNWCWAMKWQTIVDDS